MMNKVKGNISVNIIDPPGFGPHKSDTIDDLALLTGAKVINEELGDDLDLIQPDCLGEVSKSVTDSKNTVLKIKDLNYDIEERITEVEKKIDKEKDYFLAAKCLVIPEKRIVFGHLLPNCLPPLIVLATINLAFAITLEASLSFLGVGLPITEPSLGLLIANGYEYIISGKYWISVYPGIFLLITVVSINVFADRLRIILNPRLNK